MATSEGFCTDMILWCHSAHVSCFSVMHIVLDAHRYVVGHLYTFIFTSN